MVVQLSHAGTLEQAQPWLDIFIGLNPTSWWKKDSLLPTEIQPAASQDIDSDIWYVTPDDYHHVHGDGHANANLLTSKVGTTWRLFPVGLKEYNTTANRQVYNLFKQLIAEHPEFSSSVVQFENYAQEGMRAVDSASTAYPHRDDDILV